LLDRAFFTGDRARITPFPAEYKPQTQSTSRKIVSSAASPIVFVLTTLGADAEASVFARTLVQERLAACVSVLPPMTSVYRWKGDLEEAREQQLVIKTTADCVAALAERFRSLHPYELPEFVIVRPEDVSPLYGQWVRESVR
jgi:periplasmic divalent cation tolerance protein